MGIRVDEESLKYQLDVANCNDRKELDYHKSLLNGELPYTCLLYTSYLSVKREEYI